MTFLVIIRAIAVICTGLAAGIYLGHRRGVSPAARVIGPPSFVRLQQVIHIHFARMMPPLVLGSTLGSLIWTILLRDRWQTAEWWLVALSAAAMLAVAVMTRVVNIPINKRLMTWDANAPPADVWEIWSPWEQVHTVRSVLAILALICQVVALSTYGSS